MTITELREKRARLWNTMEGFLDTHRNDMGVLKAEDDATYSNMEGELDSLTNEIHRMERREVHEKELNKAVNTPIVTTPVDNKPERTGRASDEYREDFQNHLRGRAQVHNVLSEGTEADGGFLVPTEFETSIVSALEEENIIRSLAKVITTQHERKIPIATGHSVAQWTAENAAYTESNPTFGQKQLDAFKLTDLCRVSTELLQDSAFDIEDYLMKEFARAFGIAEEEAFCVGTGTNQPTGIFTAKGGEVGVTAGSTVNVTADEIIDLYYSLKAPYRKNGVWLLNDSTVNIIRKLKDSNGQYLWQPSIKDGETDTLLGKPVYTSSSIANAASGTKPIAFGDLSYYWIGDRQGVTFRRLNELYAANGQVGFLTTKRVDARLIVPEAVKILKMKGTVSTGG